MFMIMKPTRHNQENYSFKHYPINDNNIMSLEQDKILEFIKEKETKNTIRYQEVKEGEKEDIVIGPLYIQKSFLPDKIPEKIKITIHINT